jgi:coenzyme F420-reducing hydrogenase gamma subunit
MTPPNLKPAMPRVAVHKFSSCDGCQLAFLNLGEDLLTLAERVELVHFAEAGPLDPDAEVDVSFVEGSVSTAEDVERIRHIRAHSKVLIAIGACATSGGIQALRNFADVDEFIRVVYARPDYIETLATSTPISDHVKVDFELRGCPLNKHQLLEVLAAFLRGRQPATPGYSVCVECKQRGNPCVMVAHGTPCLGPVTHAGCGAICPAYNRGCYGCFGPMETPNVRALNHWLARLGADPKTIARLYGTFNVNAEPFRAESQRHD